MKERKNELKSKRAGNMYIHIRLFTKKKGTEMRLNAHSLALRRLVFARKHHRFCVGLISTFLSLIFSHSLAPSLSLARRMFLFSIEVVEPILLTVEADN